MPTPIKAHYLNALIWLKILENAILTKKFYTHENDVSMTLFSYTQYCEVGDVLIAARTNYDQ